MNLKKKKNTKTKTKQTTRTGTKSQKWRSFDPFLRELSTGEWEGERGGKGTENK